MRMIAVLSRNVVGNTRHYMGMPPILTGGIDYRQDLGPARFLVIEEKPDGIFLYRYGSGGEFAGDTWHQSMDDAKHQVAFEYGDSVGDWREVPLEISDVIAYVVHLAKS